VEWLHAYLKARGWVGHFAPSHLEAAAKWSKISGKNGQKFTKTGSNGQKWSKIDKISGKKWTKNSQKPGC
jgi:hypothetical protein